MEDPLAGEDETPKHQVTLPGYWIGKTPVTVAQFRVFVEAEGYKIDENALEMPDDYPVVLVSWNDALAYCYWISKRSGLTVMLPSEAEWEKAARGTDGRLYPWGDEEPDAQRCNYGNKVGMMTPVGRYSPQGNSLYGCMDMVGNVWEWTRSLYKNYPYDPKDGRENLKSRDLRVLRGESFDGFEWNVRCTTRSWDDPDFCNDNLGFRVVLPHTSDLWPSGL